MLDLLITIGEYFVGGFFLFVCVGIPIIFVIDGLTGFTAFGKLTGADLNKKDKH